MTVLKITKIPQLNNVVIKQEGGHFFIAAPNTFIIDKAGFLMLIKELIKIDFITFSDLPTQGYLDVSEYYKEEEENEN